MNSPDGSGQNPPTGAYATPSIREEEAEIKYFIHDLRIQKFFHSLIGIHQKLVSAYQENEMAEASAHHEAYLNRLNRALEASKKSHQSYQVAVKAKAKPETVIETGRAYIDATLEACRISRLPHWRVFREFLGELPEDAPVRKLERRFNETKTWIGAIDRRIINFSRYHNAETPMAPIAVDEQIQKYVEEQLRFYVRSAGGKRLEINLGRLNPGYIYGDMPRFRRLLFNLVMNACDAMRHKRTGTILAEVLSTDLLVTIEVTDEGVGMSQRKVEQILTDSKDLRGELHSLGFRFVRETVKDFVGKLYIESELGRGTKIRLKFPRYRLDEEELLVRPVTSHDPTGEVMAVLEPTLQKVEGAEKAGNLILDDFCRSLAPLPGCLFSITITPEGEVDHFVHRPYDPDWMMGHDDLAPMLYEAVFRGRYETDETHGSALILKAPHKLEEYWDLRAVPTSQRERTNGLRLLHDEYVMIARHLIQTGMEGETTVYLTNLEQCFTAFGQSFSEDPFQLRKLAAQALLETP